MTWKPKEIVTCSQVIFPLALATWIWLMSPSRPSIDSAKSWRARLKHCKGQVNNAQKDCLHKSLHQDCGTSRIREYCICVSQTSEYTSHCFLATQGHKLLHTVLNLIYSNLRKESLTHLWISMSFNVHLRKWTHIADTNNIDSEISEEIHYVQSFVA